MPRARFTSHLQKFFPTLEQGITVQGDTVADVVQALDARYPGIASYFVDERGALRKHVNVFIGDEFVLDRTTLADRVKEDQVVFFMQALSGG
ncbi:MAG: MoaD/ThiS family protein [Chloroflexi bacterium]|nr:MoaD/ThiS family protein [Chloroflexota bacterium]